MFLDGHSGGILELRMYLLIILKVIQTFIPRLNKKFQGACQECTQCWHICVMTTCLHIYSPIKHNGYNLSHGSNSRLPGKLPACPSAHYIRLIRTVSSLAKVRPLSHFPPPICAPHSESIFWIDPNRLYKDDLSLNLTSPLTTNWEKFCGEVIRLLQCLECFEAVLHLADSRQQPTLTKRPFRDSIKEDISKSGYGGINGLHHCCFWGYILW